MAAWLTDAEARTLAAAADRLIPADGAFPGAAAAGVVAYLDRLLGAFAHDPPHIWAARTGAANDGWLALGPAEANAWGARVEAWQRQYRSGLAALGEDFTDLDTDEQDRRLAADPEFRWQLYEHTCEAVYGDPAYAGNVDKAGWVSIGFAGDPFPRGYTPDEVTNRD
jgi:hypothetical protein